MNRRAFLRGLLLLVLTLTSQPACTAQAAPNPDPKQRRVLIISIDGLRPDLLLRADAPVIKGLLPEGTFTMWAQTTPQGITLPSHTSMFTGVTVPRHGVDWNGDVIPPTSDGHPKVPTLFDLGHKAGFTTAIVAGKAKFKALVTKDSVDHALMPPAIADQDPAVAEASVKVIREHKPQIMLVHLPNVDHKGHGYGWSSSEQMQAIAVADQCVGLVLEALKDAGVLEQTLIIITSDHGGFGKGHHGGDPRGLHIPWIVVGPGVIKNHDLTIHRELVVSTWDTFATASDYLGLKPEGQIDGKPIKEIFGGRTSAVEVPDFDDTKK